MGESMLVSEQAIEPLVPALQRATGSSSTWRCCFRLTLTAFLALTVGIGVMIAQITSAAAVDLPAGVRPVEPGPWFFGIASSYALGLLALLWGTTLGFLITARWMPGSSRCFPMPPPRGHHLPDGDRRVAAARRGHMLGGVWANEAWGRFWGWDPKETWALITWIYAGYLPLPAHKRVWARLTPAGVELGAASHRNADAFRLEFESICAAVGLDGLNQRPALAA